MSPRPRVFSVLWQSSPCRARRRASSEASAKGNQRFRFLSDLLLLAVIRLQWAAQGRKVIVAELFSNRHDCRGGIVDFRGARGVNLRFATSCDCDCAKSEQIRDTGDDRSAHHAVVATTVAGRGMWRTIQFGAHCGGKGAAGGAHQGPQLQLLRSASSSSRRYVQGSCRQPDRRSCRQPSDEHGQ